ncbi:MAG TPA: glycosyltransferase [Solirubrobacteraceae bacterium]|jgi:glycosyltransferase involved in cell wall biosynthesis
MTALPRTLFVAKGNGSVAWYRCALPAMALGLPWVGASKDDPSFTVCTGDSVITGLEGLFDYEVVILQQPVGAAWARAIRRLQEAGVTVLFEIDDYVQAIRKMRDHDFAHTFTKENLQAFEIAMRAADGLVVSTEWLAKRYRAVNPNVWVCRNGIDLRRYALTRPARPEVNIGWAGGTGHREAIAPWLGPVAEVMQAHPAARFVSVGQPFAHELAPVVGAERTLAVPFSPLDTYPAAMTLFDVALAPAGKGNFFRGKSDLRWLEASALGVPVVADPDVYPEIEHGVTGFHAATPAEAREHLGTLVADPALRARVGEAARAYVTEHRSVQAMAPQWTRAITEAAALPRTAGRAA